MRQSSLTATRLTAAVPSAAVPASVSAAVPTVVPGVPALVVTVVVSAGAGVDRCDVHAARVAPGRLTAEPPAKSLEQSQSHRQ
jgi:hypothetical protein